MGEFQFLALEKIKQMKLAKKGMNRFSKPAFRFIYAQFNDRSYSLQEEVPYMFLSKDKLQYLFG